MSAAPLPALAPGLLPHLPRAVRQPDYDRTALRAGMAHVGVGAFHRAHQAEYTDDLLERSFDRWGTVGINIRPPQVEPTLGRQSGLYTRLVRENERAEARVIGSILSVVDAQEDPAPALAVLASADIDVVTLTVTEKGYCHKPATGVLDEGAPGIAHDLRELSTPQTLPGLLARAMELRRTSHGRPLTVLSCDNIPANGVVLGNVVRALAERRGRRLADWIAANAAFPSSMVDRIAPAVTPADAAFVEGSFGYRDGAVAVGEPFRQWVIEKRFAGRVPRWDLAGATFVDDVEPFEHLKMRVLNGAQTALCYLGVLVGHEHTSDDMRDPLLSRFVRRMLLEETLSTLAPVPGIEARAYVEQSLSRLRNTAIRHRNHQIATDGSQKIVQRLLNPIRERLRRGHGITLLATAVAAWMAYLVRAAPRFGRQWTADDPYAGRIAAITERIGNDAAALVSAILDIDAIFSSELAGSKPFRDALAEGLAGFLGPDPVAHLRRVCKISPDARLSAAGQTA